CTRGRRWHQAEPAPAERMARIVHVVTSTSGPLAADCRRPIGRRCQRPPGRPPVNTASGDATLRTRPRWSAGRRDGRVSAFRRADLSRLRSQFGMIRSSHSSRRRSVRTLLLLERGRCESAPRRADSGEGKETVRSSQRRSRRAGPLVTLVAAVATGLVAADLAALATLPASGQTTSVIVRRVARTGRLADVETDRAGGTIHRRLDVIDGFLATLPAGRVEQLR